MPPEEKRQFEEWLGDPENFWNLVNSIELGERPRLEPSHGAAAISILERHIPGINKVSPSRSKYDGAFASSDE